MNDFARPNVIRVLLASLFAIFVFCPFHQGSCFAEGEIPVPDEETFALPESGMLWTRDGNPAGVELSWAEAHEFLNDLNKEKFAGCEGWRLPSREELQKMLAYLDSGNADDENIVPEQDDYWSSSADPLESGYADVVNMGDGSVDICQKTDFNYVWPVCDR